MKIFREGQWLKLFIIGILLRILLASFLYHTDLKEIYKEAQFFDYGFSKGYQIGIDEKTPLYYPPPIYLIYNSYRKVGHFLFSSYLDGWMKDWSYSQVFNHPQIFRDLLVMKLPLIFFDLLAAITIILLVPTRKRELAAALWLFNPFSIYAIYGFGQFDIIPTFFVLLSLFFWRNKKFHYSYAALGFAAGIKVFPLLLVPYYLLLDPRAIKEKITGAIVALASFLVCLGPILTSMVALRSIFLSNLTGGIFQARIPIGSMFIPIYITLYLFFFVLIIMKAIKPSLESAIFLVLGTLLGLSSFHPQWMIWIMPFLFILVLEEKVGWKEVLVMMFSYVAVALLIDDSFVSLGLLRGINNTFATLASIRSYFDKVGIGSQLQGSFSALLVASVIIIDLEILKKIISPFKLGIHKPRIFQITSAWVIGLTALFFLAHIPLALLGRYLDTDNMVEQSRIVLSRGTTVTQKIYVENPNFSEIELRLKNVNLQNKQIHTFSILDEQGALLHKFNINGSSIGDDFNLDLSFSSIPNSQGKYFTLKIDVPADVKEGSEIILPYDMYSADKGLSINNKSVEGKLAYFTYYKLGSFWDNVSFSLNNILRKL